MLKKEINFISDLNINKLQILGDRFTISDLNKSDIHPALLKYISSSIDYEIFLDRKRIESNSIFNYNNDRISNYFSLIGQEIKKTHNFDFEYIKQLLQNAVIFNINFLSKPNSTLVKSIFGDAAIKNIEEIVLKLGNLYYYRYLQKILLTYLDKKQVILMRKEEFIELLDKIDLISKETHIDNTLSTVINSMSNFFDPTTKATPKIPLIAIQQYLDEKNFAEYSAKLFENFGDNPALSISSADALSVLKSVVPESVISVDVNNDGAESFIEDNSSEKAVETLEPIDTEIIEMDGNINDVDEELFTPEDDEIPNSDILSSSHSKVTENVNDKNIENFVVEESIDDLSEGGEEIDNAEGQSDSDHADDQKKKVDIRPLVDSLIDVNKLYNSLHSKTIPFNQSLKEKIIEFLFNDNGDDLNYKLDISTLNEELNLVNSPVPDSEEFSHSELKNDFESYEFSYKNNDFKNDLQDVDLDTNFDNFNFLEDKENFGKISNNKNLLIEENDEIEESNHVIIEESKLVLSEDDDQELTEVFTDLIYLNDEKKDLETESSVINEMIEEIEKVEIPEEVDEAAGVQSETNENFEEIIVTKDMTKIIENVFDYDMEDYHTLMSKISVSASETDALKIIENYCRKNHIEIKSGEVETLKSIISEFFNKIYS